MKKLKQFFADYGSVLPVVFTFFLMVYMFFLRSYTFQYSICAENGLIPGTLVYRALNIDRYPTLVIPGRFESQDRWVVVKVKRFWFFHRYAIAHISMIGLYDQFENRTMVYMRLDKHRYRSFDQAFYHIRQFTRLPISFPTQLP